jgi:regulatory protein
MRTRHKSTVTERLAAGELTQTEAFELTREAALTSLDRAMQSRHSLGNKLLQRGYPPDLVGAVLDRLVSVGVLDDTAYAQALVRARVDRGLAKRAIGVELARKGVDPESSAYALAQIDPNQQAEAAESIARKAMLRCQGVEANVAAQRIFGAVSRRGYSTSVASASVAKVLCSSVNAQSA